MKRVSIQDSIVRTSAGNSSPIDISTYIDTSLTVVIEVSNLTAGAEARLTLQSSADSFASMLEGPVFSLVGSVDKSAGIRFSLRTRDFPDLQNGVGGTSCRLALTRLTGTSPSITYSAFLEIATP